MLLIVIIFTKYDFLRGERYFFLYFAVCFFNHVDLLGYRVRHGAARLPTLLL